MATDFLREKLNVLASLIQNTELELFQLQLHVEVASAPSGDAKVDTSLSATAAAARGQSLACSRKLEVYKAKYAAFKLEQELLDASA